mgnify:CR=1 FL=1
MINMETFSLIFAELKRFLQPLAEQLQRFPIPDGMILFLQKTGVSFLPQEEASEHFRTISETLNDIIETIETIETIGDQEVEPEEILDLIKQINDALHDLTTLDLQELNWDHVAVEDLFVNIIQYLIGEYLKNYSKLFFWLLLLGILRFENSPAKPSLVFNLQLFKNLIKNGTNPFTSVYGWGGPDFASVEFYENLSRVLNMYGVSNDLTRLDENQVADHADDEHYQLIIHMLRTIIKDQIFDFKLLLKVGDNNALALVPQVSGEVSLSVPFGDGWTFNLNSKASSNEDGYGILLSPGQVSLKPLSSEQAVQAEISASILNTSSSEGGIVLLSSESTTLSVGSFEITLSFSSSRDNELLLQVPLKNGKLLLQRPKDDGFLKKILPEEGLSAPINMKVGFSSNEGFYFEGSSGFETTIAIREQIGPLHLEEIYLKFDLSDEGLSQLATTTFAFQLGPIYAAINKLGVETTLSFQENGNIGFAHLEGPKLKKPERIALAIQSDAMSGGGYLDIDQANHRYAGILNLQLQQIEITAIGLITTQLPNGQDGFSMLVSMNVQFQPGIAVGFGFNLIGLGGLVGIHRSMEVDVLRQRVKSGAVDAILFPDDPIKDADRIIGDLRTVFPPKEDHYVLAPFLKLGWGVADPSASPPQPLLEIDLGVFIQLPFTGRAILIGSLSTQLPNKKSPQLILNIDLFGDVNFAKGYVLLLGSLRNSRIQQIKLTGDFAFFVSWKAQHQFLMSVGGYHPEYRKPPNFPSLNRIKASLSSSKNLKLFGECYFAITSNTFQTGFAVQLKANYEGFDIQGHVDFNTFIRFKPFGLKADTQLSVSVKYSGEKLVGVRLYFILSGPAPWIAKGTAQLTFWGLEMEVDFKVKWGKDTAVSAPLVDPLPELRAQLQADTNWSASMLRHAQAAESLKSLEQMEEEAEKNLLLLHPAGQLSVRQQLLPLNLAISKVGVGRLEKTRSFYLENIHFGELTSEEAGIKLVPIKAHFARGQFQKLEDHEKLSTRDFEALEAGLSFQGSDDLWAFGEQAEQALEFENIIIGEDLTVQKEMTVSQLAEEEQQEPSSHPTPKSALDRHRREQQYFSPKGTKRVLQDLETYQLVDDQLKPLEDIDYPSYAHAKARLDQLPFKERRQWQIVASETLINT